MKKSKYILISTMIISSILLLLFLIQVRNTKADESEYMVDISTNPAEILFNVGNMKPGDWTTSVLEVNNEGNLDFNYSVNSHQESGDLYFYNQFFLRVSDEGGTLYEGKLKDFVNFPLGTIAAKVSHPLTFTVELPYETGNEAQGKETSFVFDFNAVGHEEQIPIDGQCFEPPFSNRNFSLQPKSTVPIKFHLRDTDGDLEKEILQNVRLEVTGPSPKESNIKYVFTQKNGELDFQKVDPPHYHAQFSPFDYPVVVDQWYTATVYVNDKEYCNRIFQVLEKGNRSNTK